jgi:hypothetical protein
VRRFDGSASGRWWGGSGPQDSSGSHDVSEEDYLEKDEPFEGMTAEEIYEQASRFEAETCGTRKRDEE